MDFIRQYRAGEYSPKPVGVATRGEFVSALSAVFEFAGDPIQAAINRGITVRTIQSFGADDLLTRGEAATMLARVCGRQVASVDAGLRAAVELGIFSMHGVASDYFMTAWTGKVLAAAKAVVDRIEAEAVAAAEAEEARIAAEKAAAAVAAERARMEAEAAEAARVEAERLAAELAEADRLEAARVAAELAAAVAAAEAEAALAAGAVAARVRLESLLDEFDNEDWPEVPREVVEPSEAPVEDEEVGGLLRRFIRWIVSIVRLG